MALYATTMLALGLEVANITETQAAELLEAKTCKPNLSEHVVADVLAGGTVMVCNISCQLHAGFRNYGFGAGWVAAFG